MNALRIVTAEVVIAAPLAIAACVGLARAAWREVAETRARHDAWLERLSDAGWWLT